LTTKTFTQDQLEAIAAALGDTDLGLSNTEIEFLFTSSKLVDPGPSTKRIRIYNAFATSQNERRDRLHVLAFIRQAMAPARYARSPDRYEPMRANLNRALAFCGLEVTQAGALQSGQRVQTLPDAEIRARELRADMVGRGVHADVLRFCKAELIADDYFHAVQEATKSVADKIRSKTGLLDDGSALVDRALSGSLPMLAISPLKTPSEKSEQTGFANLVRGVFGMFRNPTAHEPRVHWNMAKSDAEDILTIVSLIHRRLDQSWMPPRS